MIRIEKIFFCDHIKEGQFGKFDIVGLIPTNALSLTAIPYNLVSNLVVSGKTDEQFEHLSINIIFQDQQGNITNEITSDFSSPVEKPNTFIPLFIILPIKIMLNYFGTMQIAILHKKNKIYSEQYEIVKGAAPYTGIKEHIPASKIFQGNDQADLNFVINLLSTANQSLRIFESYSDPISLKQLLSKVPKTTKIEVITFPKHKKIFLSDPSFNSMLPNIEIRISSASHDRFIIINNSEFYHFGHSLKDISKKKVSRFSKITAKDEVMKLEKIWGDTWKTSKKI